VKEEGGDESTAESAAATAAAYERRRDEDIEWEGSRSKEEKEREGLHLLWESLVEVNEERGKVTERAKRAGVAFLSALQLFGL
jgi:hypothetical protein